MKYAKTPTVYQMEATECGAASLSMIFAYFGKYMSLEQLRIETDVTRDGCKAGRIMHAARKYGLECHGYGGKEPEELRKLQPPCIIHWCGRHFVVFEGFKGNYAWINDPALGRRRVSMEELDDCFTGIVLTFKPTEAFVKEKKPRTTAAFIKKRIAGQYGVLAKLVAIGLLLVFPGIVLPVLSQIFMDDVLLTGNTDWFTGLMAFMGAAILVQGALTLYRDLLLVKLQKKMVLLSAREFLSHLFRLPLSFFDQRFTGDLAGRVASNANVSDFLAGDLAETVLNLFVAVFYLGLLLIYSPLLTVIAVAGVLVNLLVMKMTSSVIADGAVKLGQDTAKLSDAVYSGLSISSTLKASGAEAAYVSRILGYAAKVGTQEQKQNRIQQMVNAIPDAVKMLADCLLLLVGGALVIDGRMTIGMLVAFTTLFGSFNEPVDRLVGFVRSIQTTKADINRVQDIMNYPEDSAYAPRDKKPMTTKLDGAVELKDVSFGYSRLKPPIVSDFNFKINCGSSIAFVGASGCGKSTISKVVSGLYAPWTGTVSFDGIPLENIPREVVNASIATVSQDITLFSGSVRDNLTMWNSNVFETDMIAAAKDACIHDAIAQKPGAYDFMLTQGATNLSGGQRQRLEIARALVTNPTVLIMDEATSALDPVVEKQVIDNIKRRGCTCVIVAHRLSAIRDCDQIIVMDHGRIVQRGTHQELAAVDGHYKEFIRNL